MTRLDITDVIHHRPYELPIKDAHIDYPRTGPFDGYAFEINGWVVGDAPLSPLSSSFTRRPSSVGARQPFHVRTLPASIDVSHLSGFGRRLVQLRPTIETRLERLAPCLVEGLTADSTGHRTPQISSNGLRGSSE
jgi:hypothetical protein